MHRQRAVAVRGSELLITIFQGLVFEVATLKCDGGLLCFRVDMVNNIADSISGNDGSADRTDTIIKEAANTALSCLLREISKSHGKAVRCRSAHHGGVS